MEGEIDREAPVDVSSPSSSRWARWKQSEHAGGLLLIGLFKLSKAILSVALGVGALRLIHHDLAAVVLHLSDAFRIDPESRLVSLLMNKADLIGSHQLRQFSALTFTYAAVCLVEGTGLMLEKQWAEYFTLTLTIVALPWESFELVKHFTLLRVALLVINLLVLAYLVWLLQRIRRRREPEVAD